MADYSQGPVGGPAPEQHGAPAAHNVYQNQDTPEYPRWLPWLLIPIFLLTIIVIGLMAYVVYALGGSPLESLGFNLFAGIWGFIVTIYIFLALVFVPGLHNKWVVFVLSVLSCIFWLVGFAFLASHTHQLFQYIDLIGAYSSFGYGGSLYGYSTSGKRSLPDLATLSKRYSYSSAFDDTLSVVRTIANCMAGGAGVGAIIWILWLVFTVFYSIALFRGTKINSGGVAAPAPAPNYEPKVQMPQQVYAGQPYTNQPPQPYQPTMSPGPQSPYQNTMSPPPQDFAQPTAYTPVKPSPAYDPRAEGQVMTPPPPQQQTYVNPQFGSIQEMPANPSANVATH